jgi:hypothetical protein
MYTRCLVRDVEGYLRHAAAGRWWVGQNNQSSDGPLPNPRQSLKYTTDGCLVPLRHQRLTYKRTNGSNEFETTIQIPAFSLALMQ